MEQHSLLHFSILFVLRLMEENICHVIVVLTGKPSSSPQPLMEALNQQQTLNHFKYASTQQWLTHYQHISIVNVKILFAFIYNQLYAKQSKPISSRPNTSLFFHSCWSIWVSSANTFCMPHIEYCVSWISKNKIKTPHFVHVNPSERKERTCVCVRVKERARGGEGITKLLLHLHKILLFCFEWCLVLRKRHYFIQFIGKSVCVYSKYGINSAKLQTTLWTINDRTIFTHIIWPFSILFHFE